MIATKPRAQEVAAPTGPRPELGPVFYFLAFNLANVFYYLFLLAMAKGLNAQDYGLFVALFGIVHLTSAIGSSVQVTLAKFTAELSTLGEEERLGSLLVAVAARTVGLALLVALPFLAGAPLLAAFLHSGSPVPIVVGGLVVFLTLTAPITWGVLQGWQQFFLLGTVTLLNGVVRLVCGLALVFAGLEVSGALLGIGLGLLVSGVVALGPIQKAASRRSGKPEMGAVYAYSWPVVMATIVVATPSSLDVVLAKHLFAAEQAGIYAGACVLGKIIIFLPLAATFAIFPKVVRGQAQGEQTGVLLGLALLITGVLSAAVAGVFVFAPSSLFAALLGSDLADAGQILRWYAPAMLCFALVIVFIYYNLAAGRTAYVPKVLLPGVLAQIALWLVGGHSPTLMAQMTLAGSGLLLLASVLYSWVPWRERRVVRWLRAEREELPEGI